MTKQHRYVVLSGLIAYLMLAGACGSTAQENVVTLTTEQGRFSFTVEIADTPQERQVGLMGRTDLTAQQGMLFIFSSPALNSFWMKDTPLALDIIFIGEEELVQQIAANTVPFSEELISPDQAYLFVLEVLAGTAADIGLQVGDRITLPPR